MFTQADIRQTSLFMQTRQIYLSDLRLTNLKFTEYIKIFDFSSARKLYCIVNSSAEQQIYENSRVSLELRISPFLLVFGTIVNFNGHWARSAKADAPNNGELLHVTQDYNVSRGFGFVLGLGFGLERVLGYDLGTR